jgi:hypothetical protein
MASLASCQHFACELIPKGQAQTYLLYTGFVHSEPLRVVVLGVIQMFRWRHWRHVSILRVC